MAGKEEEFKKIIKKNEARINKIIRYYSSNTDDQKDLYQEVLVNIWKSLDSFRNDAKLSTWVYRICVNTALGFARKEIHRQKIFVKNSEEKIQNILDYDISPAKEKEKLLEALEAKINMLPIVDKIIITLVLESVNYKEIANIIGITETNVRVKVLRIKSKLKEMLKTLKI